jgi:hypothetical protein
MSRIFSEDMYVGDCFPVSKRMVYPNGHSDETRWRYVEGLSGADEIRFLDMAERYEALKPCDALVVSVEDTPGGRFFTAVWSSRAGKNRKVIVDVAATSASIVWGQKIDVLRESSLSPPT